MAHQDKFSPRISDNPDLAFLPLDSIAHVWKTKEEILKDIEAGKLKKKDTLYLSDGKSISNQIIKVSYLLFENPLPDWCTHFVILK